MLPRFYIIHSPDHPWGDYGHTLTQGDSYRIKGGSLEIYRTGPFVPPITLPGMGEVVVTDTVRQALERSELKGFGFEPAIKKLIVRSDWHNWDQNADEPFEHPESGEPENYILGQPHSADASEKMGNLWALMLDKNAEIRREEPPPSLPSRVRSPQAMMEKMARERRGIRLVAESWKGHDIFRAQGVGYVYVTEPAKLWFENNVPGQLTFEEVSTIV